MHEEETSGRVVTDERRLWDGRYKKDFYRVYVDGESVRCWPNAGRMVAVDGSGRQWGPEDGVEVELDPEAEDELIDMILADSVDRAEKAIKFDDSMRARLERRRQNALAQVSLAVRERVEVAPLESNMRVIVEGKPWARTSKTGLSRGVCKHKFGLAGGFTECSACGVKRDKACTHSFGFAGGFDACTMCREGV